MKQAARWTALIALFAIPFLPLYVASDLFFPFITGKNFAFRILVEIALAAYVLLAIVDRRYRPKFSWTLVLFGALTAWMFVANLMGVLPHKAFWSNFERMDGWVTLVHLFVFFVVAGSVLSVEKLWRRWWLFFVSVAATASAFGLVELAGADGVRLAGTLGNPIYYAVYLMFAIFVAAWLAIESRGGLRYALIAFLPLAGLILFFTGSRGPLIGLGAGVIVAATLWLFLARTRKDGSMRTETKLAAAALVISFMLAGALFLARDTAIVRESFMLSRAASVFSLGEELKVRGTIWSMALEGAQEDLVTGYGQEGFNQVFNEYYRPSMYAQEPWFDRVHNMYLDWLIAGGIPALLLFVLLLGMSILTLLRAPQASPAERVLLVSALVAYAVQAIVVFDNLFSYVPLVMLFAMAHAASARPIQALEALPEARSESTIGFASAGMAVLAIALVWTVNVPSIRAANHLVYALSPSPNGVEQNLTLFKKALADGSFGSQEIREQLVSFAADVSTEPKVSTSTRAQFATFALEEMGKEVAVSPNDARLRIQYASAFETAGDQERSLEQLDEALRLSPKKQSIILNRGFKLYEMGRLEEARAAFRAAYDLDRSFDGVAMSAATGYIVSGDLAGGKALLVEAVGTTTPDNDPLFYAYYQTKQWNELIGVAQAGVLAEKGSKESRFRLAQAYAAAGRFAEARTEIETTMLAYPSARAEGAALLKQMPTVR